MSCVYTYNGVEFQNKKELGEYLSQNGISESANIEYILDAAAPLAHKETKTDFASEITSYNNNRISIGEQGYNGVKSSTITEKDMEDFVNNVVPFQDTQVKESINNWMKKLGVSKEYREEMNVRAVADLLNNLILVGQNTLNTDVIEEISHFALEMWSGSDINNTDWRGYVKNSDKYAKYNNQYREQYRKEGLSGDALEQKVDKEILGKILADVLFDTIQNPQKNNRQYTGFFGTIKKFINDFIAYFNNNREVENLLNEIAYYLNRAEDTSDTFENRAFDATHYYSMEYAESIRQDINAALSTRLAKVRAAQTADMERRAEIASQLAQNPNITPTEIFEKTGMRLVDGVWTSNESIYDDAVVNVLKQLSEGVASRNPSAIANFLSISIDEVAKLSITLKDLVSKKYESGALLSYVDSAKIGYYVDEVSDIIGLLEDEIKQISSSDLSEAHRERLINTIDALSINIQNLSRMWNQEGEFQFEKLMNSEFESLNVPESERVIARRSAKDVMKEISGFVSNIFGQSSFGNIYSSMIFKIVTQAKNTAVKNFNDIFMNGYAREILDLNVSFEQMMTLQEKREGKRTGYMINRNNLGYIQHQKHQAMKLILDENPGSFLLTKEDIDKIDAGETAYQVLGEQAFKEYQELDMDIEYSIRENQFTDDYYKENEDKLFDIIEKALNITDKKEKKKLAKEMRARTSPLYRERTEIYSKYKTANGRIDFNKISESDLKRLDEIAVQIKKVGNEYDFTGIKKTGVDLQIAQLIKARNDSFNTDDTNAPTEAELTEYMEAFRANGSKLAWIKKTGVITFAEDFQKDIEEKLTGMGSFKELSDKLDKDDEKARNFITTVQTMTGVPMKDNSEAEIEKQLEILKQQKNELLKPYKKGQEVNVRDVPSLILERFQEVSEVLTQLNANKKLNNEEKAKKDELDSKIVPTEQYNIDLAEAQAAGLEEEFLKNHTKNGRPKSYYTKFINSVEVLEYSGASIPGKDVFEEGNESLIYHNTSTNKFYKLDKNGVIKETNSPFARTAVNEVLMPSTQRANGARTYMIAKIQPNGMYREAKSMEAYVNPNYNKNTKDKHPQYKDTITLGGKTFSTLNDEYFNTFGISKTDPKETPTRNIELFEARRKMLEMKEEVDKNHLNQKNAYYVLPQVYKEPGEALMGGSKNLKATLKSWVEKNLLSNEQDVEEQGESKVSSISQIGFTEGKVRRNAPKMYTAKINPNLLSENMMGMYLKYAHKGLDYSELTIAAIKVERYMNIIRNKKMVNGGNLISGENSNLYKGVDAWVKKELYSAHSANLGGTRVFGKVWNHTKMLNTVRRYAGTMNIARNVWVALAGTSSSYVNYFVQKYSAFNGSNKDFSFASEISNGALVNGIGEFAKRLNENKYFMIMNEFGLEERLDNIINKASKTGAQNAVTEVLDGYAMMKGMDMPHKLRSLTLALLTYRKINDKMYSWQSWMTEKTGASSNYSMTYEEAEAEWNKNIDNALLNHVKVENGKVVVEDEYKEVYKKAATVAKQITSKLTGNQFEMDMPNIFRNPILGLLGMHKGWFYSALNQRFGLKTLNTDLGIYVEGNYLIAWRNLQALRGQLLFYKSVLNNNELTFAEKTAIRKVCADIYATLAALAIFMILNSMADDDDEKDNWALQQMAYLSTRVYGEVVGSTGVGLAGTAYETAKNPVGALSRHFDVFLDAPSTLANYDEEIKRGNFKGMDKGSAFLWKLSSLQNMLKFQNQREANKFTREKQHGTAEWIRELLQGEE